MEVNGATNNPIFIKKIKIKNLFGSKSIEWDLRKDVNILGGANGSGKSTIINACYELLGDKGIHSLKCIRLIEAINIEFSNGYSVTWQRNNVKLSDEIKLPSEGGVFQIVDDTINNIRYCNKVVVQRADGEKCPIEELTSNLVVENINSFEQRVSDAIRLSKLPDVPKEDDYTLLDAMINVEVNHRNEVYSGAYEEFMNQLREKREVSLNGHGDIEEYFKLVAICGEFFNYGMSLMSRMEFVKDGVRIPYTNLSMGQKQLLLVLLKATNTQHKNAIFFMDEPDLGMHVDWKKKLLKTIRRINPNIQQIVSTHAPSMVTGWGECVKEIGQISLNEED